jgi:integrase
MLTAMEQGGTSARVRQMTFNVLHRALGQALLWGMVPRNVCDAVVRPRVPRPTMRTLAAAQVRLLLAEAKSDRLEALYVVAVSTGMRQGELLGLQWENMISTAVRCRSATNSRNWRDASRSPNRRRSSRVGGWIFPPWRSWP